MNKIKSLLLLSVIAFLASCNNDEKFLSFTITATAPQQVSWNSGDKLAVFPTGKSGITKQVFTYGNGNSFTGSISNQLDDGIYVGAFFPADVIWVNNSDTLYQRIDVTGQDGTAQDARKHSYAYANGKISMTDIGGSVSLTMKQITCLVNLSFTKQGAPLQNIQRITMSALSGSLCSSWTVGLNDGKADDEFEGNVVINNPSGLSEAIVALFPSKSVRLHFTVVTADGQVCEGSLPEAVELVAGESYTFDAINCQPMAKAKIGDYYYSDNTYSTEFQNGKEPIGLVFALTDADDNILANATESAYGRIVALRDTVYEVVWQAVHLDAEALPNTEKVDGTLNAGLLPYYAGFADTYFDNATSDAIKGITISDTGSILSWPTSGALNDFRGYNNTQAIPFETAAKTAYTYARPGMGQHSWYLPAAGELALLWTLQCTGILNENKQPSYINLKSRSYWSSTEYDEEKAWYVNFISGYIAAVTKYSKYNVRPTARF